ncbi:threonine aldolase family protein [Nonlabens sp.]|uniref:threonine aldolase family protein n=1 Tax=Nonlabens sp. TaxID=1888209 RepID=UPI003F6970BF
MIDLRSDTVTKPTPAMMQAIMKAQVGDDVYKEDPTVLELEHRIADMLGMDQALFFPTGTMANQAAIKLHTKPGEQLICDKYAHVYNYEGGGVSFNSGVSCKLVDGHRGMITAQQVEENINPPDFYHSPLTSLVCLENTTNKGGGACYSIDTFKEIKKITDKHGLGLHLDGARLWNALVATGQNPKEYGEIFDTVSICMSKGMGAPLGTVLAGNNELMENAIRVRKILGGGMRQVGFMAAAALHAMDHHKEFLKEDHKKAQELAAMLQTMSIVHKVDPVETNIIIFEVTKEQLFKEYLTKNGVIFSDMGQGKLRLVTHYDYNDVLHEQMLDILRAFKAL